MKAKLLTLALMTGLAGPLLPVHVPGLSPTAQAATLQVPDPGRQVRDTVALFRRADVAGLAQALIPPEQWNELRLAYELHRLEPVDEAERAEFAENMARLTAPDAVDQLMAELEPRLDEARPQVPGALLMAFGAMQMAIASPESELTESQRAALQSVLPGFQRWASTTDFLSPDTLRRSLTLITDAARRTGIEDLDQLQALPLEAALDRAGTVLTAVKQAVRLYGVDLDQVADSLQVEVLEIDGDRARVKTTVTVFDAPVWNEHELVLIEGRWYGRHAVVQFGRGQQDREKDADGAES